MFSAILIEGRLGPEGRPHQSGRGATSRGDVSVDVEYSTLNFKDGLAITGKSPVVRKIPDGSGDRPGRRRHREFACGLESGRPGRAERLGCGRNPLGRLPSGPGSTVTGWRRCRRPSRPNRRWRSARRVHREPLRRCAARPRRATRPGRGPRPVPLAVWAASRSRCWPRPASSRRGHRKAFGECVSGTARRRDRTWIARSSPSPASRCRRNQLAACRRRRGQPHAGECVHRLATGRGGRLWSGSGGMDFWPALLRSSWRGFAAGRRQRDGAQSADWPPGSGCRKNSDPAVLDQLPRRSRSVR